VKRRAFLGAAASGAALLTQPAWLRQAFAGDSCDDKMVSLVAITTAFRRAHDAGKPLLVFVIPADDGDKYSRGQAFGELLNHASQAQLALLALVEVVCATMDSVRRVAPSVGGGEPLMLLIDADAVPATVRRLDARLPTLDSNVPWDERDKREAELVDQRIAALSRLIGGALAPDVATLTKRAALTRSKLASADVARLEHTLAGTDNAPVGLVDAGAAIVAHAGANIGRSAVRMIFKNPPISATNTGSASRMLHSTAHGLSCWKWYAMSGIETTHATMDGLTTLSVHRRA